MQAVNQLIFCFFNNYSIDIVWPRVLICFYISIAHGASWVFFFQDLTVNDHRNYIIIEVKQITIFIIITITNTLMLSERSVVASCLLINETLLVASIALLSLVLMRSPTIVILKTELKYLFNILAMFDYLSQVCHRCPLMAQYHS